MIDGLRQRELRQRLQRASARMTPLQRDVMRQLRFDETSSTNVAAALGVAEAEVCQAFTAALVILDQELERPFPWWKRLRW